MIISGNPQLITLTGDYDEYMGRRGRRRRRKLARGAGLFALGPIGRMIALRRIRKKRRAAGKPVGIRARIKDRRGTSRKRGRAGLFFAPPLMKLAILRRMKRRKRRDQRRAVYAAKKRGNYTNRAFKPSPVSAYDYKSAPVSAVATGSYMGNGSKFKKFLSKLSYDTKEGTVKYQPGKGLTLTTPKPPEKQGIFSTTTAGVFNKKNMIPLVIGGGVLLYVFSQRNKGLTAS